MKRKRKTFTVLSIMIHKKKENRNGTYKSISIKLLNQIIKIQVCS